MRSNASHVLLTVLVVLLGLDVLLRVVDRPLLPAARADGSSSGEGCRGPVVIDNPHEGLIVVTASADGRDLYAFKCVSTGIGNQPPQFKSRKSD